MDYNFFGMTAFKKCVNVCSEFHWQFTDYFVNL